MSYKLTFGKTDDDEEVVILATEHTLVDSIKTMLKAGFVLTDWQDAY